MIEINANLEAAKARVRALEARLSIGSGTIWMMSASDNARSRKTYQRRKQGYRSADISLPEELLIRATLKSGWYVRPKSGEPTFEGAVEALERMILRFISETNLTREVQKFRGAKRSSIVDTNHEATENEHADAKS
jgi:hypothetical protein